MSRRFLLALTILLCLGLSLPALAVPGQDSGSGQGGGPPTTVTNPGSGQGGGPPTTVTTQASGNGQGNVPPTTVTTQASGNGNGNGQGNGSSTTVTTPASGNGQANGNGQGNGNGSATPVTTQAPQETTPEAAATDRVAVFLAPLRDSLGTDSAQPVVDQGQSSPERMISWLLSGNEQRFLPVVASPFVALIVIGRALASAGSGAVAPIVLLVAVALMKYFDRRQRRRPATVPAS